MPLAERLTFAWLYLRGSLWPVPVLMLLAGIGLLQATAAIDAQLPGGPASTARWLHSGTGDDARNLLSTLAAAIITIASLVFSITIVALSLAANQFGSRLVLSYMRDLRTKLALGFFLLTIVFCLLALRLVNKDMPPAQVPQVTVTSALGLGISCVLLLVLFLHLVARSIVADEVIRRVGGRLEDAIDSLPLATGGETLHADPSELLPASFDDDSTVLRSADEGYIQEIRYEWLAEIAARHDLVLRVDVSAGDYLCQEGWIGRVHPAGRCGAELQRQVRSAVILGPERTPVQDLAYPVRHLVDIALRALSPGINDANTALVVIDRVRGALARLLARRLPEGVFRDAAGRCRVLGHRRTHAQLMAEALHPIRNSGAPQPLVVVALLQALGKLCEHVRSPAQAEAIDSEADGIVEVAQLHPASPAQREAIRRAREEVRAKLRAVAPAQDGLRASMNSTEPEPASRASSVKPPR